MNDTTVNEYDMRDVWSWALSWFRKPPKSVDKRARQALLVAAIKDELAGLETIPDLHHHYCADSRWVVTLARREFPRDWPTLGVHACTAAAYGIRHVEILTDTTLNPREPLPAWTAEWATF